MRLLNFVAAAAVLVSSVHAWCGADAGSREEIVQREKESVKWLENQGLANKTWSNDTVNADAQFTVPVVWTILYDRNNPSDGNISAATLDETMNVVNSFFNNVGLYFRVQDVRRIYTSRSILRNFSMDNDYNLKQRFHTGNVQTLNIYSVGPGPTRYAGWSSFPWWYRRDPVTDGIVYDYTYLPGPGSRPDFNTGKVLVHEIGHWVGLFHTFEGGCNGGDSVADTNPEDYEATGCPLGRRTCSPNYYDPVRNMMDYTNDPCRTGFTNGQYNRLRQQLYQFRGINLY